MNATDFKLAASPSKSRRVLGFILVGIAAALVDQSVLYVVHHIWGVQPSMARIASILCAILVAWNLQRLVFGASRDGIWHELRRYLLANGFARLVDYVSYLAVLQGFGYLRAASGSLTVPEPWAPNIAAFIGMALSALIAYFLFSRFVFKR